jgi:hypothetical protein
MKAGRRATADAGRMASDEVIGMVGGFSISSIADAEAAMAAGHHVPQIMWRALHPEKYFSGMPREERVNLFNGGGGGGGGFGPGKGWKAWRDTGHGGPSLYPVLSPLHSPIRHTCGSCCLSLKPLKPHSLFV